MLILVRGKAAPLILCRDLVLTCCRIRGTDRPVRRCLAPAPCPRRSRRAPGVPLPDPRLQQAGLAHPDEPADAGPSHPERTRPREPARGVPASAVRERCRAGLAKGETRPQPAPGRTGTDSRRPCSPPQRVRLLPNPTMFSINEIAFGVTSADVLWSLKSQEYFRKAPDVEPPEPGTEDPLAKDVMARTCRQLLRHRR